MNSVKPIRWGIMGTGWVAQHFMADLRHVEGAVRAAVASRSEDRARNVAKRFGMRNAHGSYEALAKDPLVDVVYVATENHLHAEHCLLALREGKHVLCEKPFSMSFESASRVVECAKSRGLFCMEAMGTRFVPAILESKRRIDAGEIGIPLLLTADFGTPISDSGSNRFYDRQRGGGALWDRGVYAISLAIWLFGKPLHITSQAQMHASGTDTTFSSVLRFPDNKLAVVSASIGAYSGNEAIVAGSAGRLRLHEPICCPQRVTIKGSSAMAGDPKSDLNPQSTRERVRRLVSRIKPYLPENMLLSTVLHLPVTGYGYCHEASEVMRCVREGLLECPLMPLGETLTIVETMENMQKNF